MIKEKGYWKYIYAWKRAGWSLRRNLNKIMVYIYYIINGMLALSYHGHCFPSHTWLLSCQMHFTVDSIYFVHRAIGPLWFMRLLTSYRNVLQFKFLRTNAFSFPYYLIMVVDLFTHRSLVEMFFGWRKGDVPTREVVKVAWHAWGWHAWGSLEQHRSRKNRHCKIILRFP